MGWNRSRQTKQKYKALYDKTCNCYGSGIWYDEEKNRYIRVYQPRRAKFVKHKCNRQVRRYKGPITSKGGYRKVAEYWWEIW